MRYRCGAKAPRSATLPFLMPHFTPSFHLPPSAIRHAAAATSILFAALIIPLFHCHPALICRELLALPSSDYAIIAAAAILRRVTMPTLRCHY